MGRAILKAKYEITPDIKKLQKLSGDAKALGCEVWIDITKDLVKINGCHNMTRAEATTHLTELIANNKKSIGTSTYPDQELQAREEKKKAKLARKHREPGAPPEFKALIRRAKRIYKKATLKGLRSPDASLKATAYLEKRATAEDLPKLAQLLVNYISKEHEAIH